MPVFCLNAALPALRPSSRLTSFWTSISSPARSFPTRSRKWTADVMTSNVIGWCGHGHEDEFLRPDVRVISRTSAHLYI